MPIFNFICNDCSHEESIILKNKKDYKCSKCSSVKGTLQLPNFSINKNTERQKLASKIQKYIKEAKEELNYDVLQRKANRTDG